MDDPAAELGNGADGSQEPDLPLEVALLSDQQLPAADNEFLNDVTQKYLNDIGVNPLLSAEEELRLARLVRQGDFAARQTMIGQSAAGGEYRQALSEPRHSDARSGRGGQSRVDSCTREVRSGTGFPFFHLCDLVDSPEY